MMFLYDSGPLPALLAAFLFGLSPVLIKLTIGEMPPVLMAGLLYLGSGIGLFAFRWIRRETILKGIKTFPPRQTGKLMGAIISGGILAPICLICGIRYATAFEVSALLNLETAATTLIAWLVFHEHVGKRVWIGKLLVITGAWIVSVSGKFPFEFSMPAFFIVAACVFWGIDNNLTRDLEEIPPSLLAGIKGLCAGGFNVSLAFLLKQTSHHIPAIAGTLAIGALSYGLSLVFFIHALRKIGAARTSAYFASGPFIGMIGAVAFLGERPPMTHWLAGIFFLAGLCVLYREHHEHEHTHEELEHNHLHTHDEHHQHKHGGAEIREPHEHLHRHKALRHSHWHLPDIHHRHRH